MNLIVKTLYGKYTYYLDKFNRWTGLKDNAQLFPVGNLDEKVRVHQNRCSVNETITTETVSTNFTKTIYHE